MVDQNGSQSRTSTRILQARYASGDEFLNIVRTLEDGARAIYYPTRIPLTGGEQVILEVLFPELPSRMLLRSSVYRMETDPPAVILLIAEEDVDTLEFVESVARGDTDPGAPKGRRYYRLPLEIPVDWQVIGQGDVIISSTDDVSGGGVQIRTQNPPPVGTEVVLLLALDDDTEQQLRIPGRVAWVRTDDNFSGMGVRFTPESTEEKRKLRDLVRKTMERGEIES